MQPSQELALSVDQKDMIMEAIETWLENPPSIQESNLERAYKRLLVYAIVILAKVALWCQGS